MRLLEKTLQNEILRRYGTRPDMRLWRMNTGAARFGNQTVRFGLPGQADLSGVLSDGRRLEIEVKSPTGRLSTDQISFGEMIKRFGGVYIVARSLDDVERGLQDAQFNGDIAGTRN